MNQSRVTKPKITAFLKEQCGWSRGIRSVLDKYGLNFEEKQIHIPENYQEMVSLSGQSLQPTLVIDEDILADISGEELETYFVENRYIQERLEQRDGVDIDTACTEEEHQQQNNVNSQTVSVTMTKKRMGGLTV